MNYTQKCFLSIISDFLRKLDSSHLAYGKEMDWNTLYGLAHSHNVEGIIYYQCKSFMPINIVKLYEEFFIGTLFLYTNRKNILKEVTDAFHKDNIPFCLIKGYSIAEFYPIAELRTMGDCDILVDKTHISKAISVMRSLGYQGIDNERASSWEGEKDGYIFEIHDNLVHTNEHLTSEQIRFFNDITPYITKTRLEYNFSFLFLLVHLRKHFMNSGVGIRQFMDLAVMVQYCSAMNWDWIENKLIELDLLKFAQSCFILIHRWFNILPPIDCGTMENEFYEKVTDKILRNGVFGNNDISNTGNFERNVLIKSEGNLLVRRLSLIIHNMFPNYEYMQGYPSCGYIVGRPYLIPVAWIHRFILYTCRDNKGTIRRVFNGALTDSKKLEDQKSFLEKMGL